MSRRTLILANALFRFGYGVGALLAPAAMEAARMVPPGIDERGRLFVRGFAGHQLAVGTLGVASVRWRRLERSALMLAAAIDAVDLLAAGVEAQARGSLDADTRGGMVLSAAGAATAAAAWLRRG